VDNWRLAGPYLGHDEPKGFCKESEHPEAVLPSEGGSPFRLTKAWDCSTYHRSTSGLNEHEQRERRRAEYRCPWDNEEVNLMAISESIVPKQSYPRRVLMLGPALSVKGGITTVEELYFQAWDCSRYTLRHIATYVDGWKLVKFLVAGRALAAFCYYLVFWRPDILHVHFAWRASIFRKAVFVLLARLWGVKILLHCHDGPLEAFYQKLGPLGRLIVRAVLNRADKLVVLSSYCEGYFQKLHLRAPVVVLNNPTARHCPVARSAHAKRVVLSLGKLSKGKGTYDTLRAVPDVLRSSADTEFWLGGDGEMDQVKAVLAAQPWCQNVRLLGWVTDKEKDRVLSAATVFLLPSYSEGFPMAVLEAMAYGLPVISTPVGGIPDAVVDGKTGFLVNPGDVQAISGKLSLLLGDPDLCLEFGANARRLVEEKFQVDVIMQRLYALYDTCLEEAKC